MDIIEKAQELGQALMNDEKVKRLQISMVDNDNDFELQKLIGEFNLKRIALNEELKKDDKDGEKTKMFEQEVKDQYQKVMENASMSEYNNAKTAVDEIVQHINSIIQVSISGEAPDEGCSGGGCSSCAGCH
jgi:cell fate (sporulation/competence/biofilm development) regulator YlbF (YheA/YmcA/DUF963 family)